MIGGRITVTRAPKTEPELHSLLERIATTATDLTARSVKDEWIEAELDTRTKFLEIFVAAQATSLMSNLKKVTKKFRGRREPTAAFFNVPHELLGLVAEELRECFLDKKHAAVSKAILVHSSFTPPSTLNTGFVVINNEKAKHRTMVLDDL